MVRTNTDSHGPRTDTDWGWYAGGVLTRWSGWVLAVVCLQIAGCSRCRPDEADRFGESTCLRGGLGQFEAEYLQTLALAHDGRLQKSSA